GAEQRKRIEATARTITPGAQQGLVLGLDFVRQPKQAPIGSQRPIGLEQPHIRRVAQAEPIVHLRKERPLEMIGIDTIDQLPSNRAAQSPHLIKQVASFTGLPSGEKAVDYLGDFVTIETHVGLIKYFQGQSAIGRRLSVAGWSQAIG